MRYSIKFVNLKILLTKKPPHNSQQFPSTFFQQILTINIFYYHPNKTNSNYKKASHTFKHFPQFTENQNKQALKKKSLRILPITPFILKLRNKQTAVLKCPCSSLNVSVNYLSHLNYSKPSP